MPQLLVNFENRLLALLVLWLTLLTGSSEAAVTNTVAMEATIRGGTYANADQDEAAAGYIHVKHSTDLSFARKAYFQFDLTGLGANPELGATFIVRFNLSNLQRVQLWALKQAYPGFGPTITWYQAQANDTTSNGLLTGGVLTAVPLGASALIPLSGTAPFAFSIARLGDVLLNNRVTLVISGVSDAANNAGGLRIERMQSTLVFNLPPSPPPHYDVYLVGGQSNADGRGTTSELVGSLAAWQETRPDVRLYYANPINLDPLNPSYETGWSLLGPGFSVPPGFTGALPSGAFGPEVAFGGAMADASAGRRLALIKVTKGGTSLSADWNPSGGYMYQTFTNITRAALQVLRDEGSEYTLRGMIWHQGESDGSVSTSTYQARLTSFINAVRNDLGSANLPFVVGELATNRSATVRQAQFNVAQVMPYVGFASSSNLPTLAPDDPHFTTPSLITMGLRMAAALETPPVRITGLSAAGSSVAVNADGLAGAPCQLLTATNPLQPRAQWTPVATNTFTPSGTATFAAPALYGEARFFRVLQQ
jgi:hypothetical protein